MYVIPIFFVFLHRFCPFLENIRNMKSIISHFAIDTPTDEPRPLKVGIINDSYIVPAQHQGDPSFFLQRINHHVFPNVDALQQNIAFVTGHIRSKLLAMGEIDIDRKVLRLIPTREGGLYYRSPEGDCWRMYLLIEGGMSKECVTPESARQAGAAFGRFQCLLSDIPLDQVAESIPNFHNMAFRLTQLREAVAADAAGRAGATREITDYLLSHADEMMLAERLHEKGELPKRINHCDTKVNNVLFSKEGEVLCIVDLDTVMPGYVLSDFGDFMRTAACTAPEDEPDVDKIHVDLAIFEAYTRGYLSTATFLTPTERDLLPFGCRLLSYMQAVRFFTDYLNGDKYYKTAYPDHNLVRTKAQIRLFEEQGRCLPVMGRIVRS